MINSINTTVQTVVTTQNVIFSADRVKTNSCKSCCGGWLSHSIGSGLFTLTKPGIYKISFNANVANSAGTGPIVFDITSSGESFSGGEMVVTPSTASAYFNISSTILVQVPCNSSITISVKNNSTESVLVSQANIVITREC